MNNTTPNQISFAIGIPTVNQGDRLKSTLQKYQQDFPSTSIFIIDNGNQNIQSENNIISQRPMPDYTRLSVAASWNVLCNIIFQSHTHAFILNDDVLYEKGFNTIIHTIQTYLADFYVSQGGFHSFILPRETYQKIGGFDENFKGAYFEDRDYERRLKIAKMHTHRSLFLEPLVYETSASIKKDPCLNKHYSDNAEYYRQKWGGNQGGETFITPFGK